MALSTISPTQIRTLMNRYPFSWARLVSDLLSPPVVMGVLAVAVAIKAASFWQDAMLWFMIYIVLVCILPLAYIAIMVQHGKITDMHMAVRRQRYLPLVILIFCNVIAYALLRIIGADNLMQKFTLFTLVQILLMTGITLFWQVSIHMISISGAIVGVAFWFGTILVLFMILTIPLVGAARINLKRHTPQQVLAGMVVGLVVPAILLGMIA